MFRSLRTSTAGLPRCLAPVLLRSLDARRRRGPVHVLLSVCDHFEPQCGKPPREQADARAAYWADHYADALGAFRDADGRPPRHTFFFPIDEYDGGHVDRIASLCRAGYGEVEIHHHHDNDTADDLRERLLYYKALFRNRHGLLPEDKRTGEVKYGFVHGNWALCNSRPDGRHCGVDNELDVLRDTGCYADFTLPSVPSDTQTRTVNSIYYARTKPGAKPGPRSHDTGVRVGTAPQPAGSLMLVQGPLLLDFAGRRGIKRVVPKIENSTLQHNQPPTIDRLRLWLRAAVQIPSRPDWFFVKLHTHGAPENNRRVLLGDAARAFHQGLSERAACDRDFHFHYVTARETYNLARAAEAGFTGPVDAARDYELVWKPRSFPGEKHACVESSPTSAGAKPGRSCCRA